MQLQVKLQKTAEITYLETNKQQTKYPLNYYRFQSKKKVTIDVLKSTG